MSQTPTQSFCNNFGKYEPVLIFFSLLHSAMNCGRSYYMVQHLTSNVLLDCLAKFECMTLHDSYSIQKCDTSFIYNKCLQKCHVLDLVSVPVNLQYYSMCSKYLPLARMHALHHACNFVNGCIVAMLCQAYSRCCHNLLCWHDAKWHHRQSGKIIELK